MSPFRRPRSRSGLRALLLVAALVPLAGCDAVTGALGIESPEKVAAARDAEGKAIGGACRHAGRAIEDCYALNKKSDKAAVFTGWRDMNDYMRENKIDEVKPQIAPNQPPVVAKAPAGEDAAAADAKGGAADAAPAKGEVAAAKTKPAHGS